MKRAKRFNASHLVLWVALFVGLLVVSEVSVAEEIIGEGPRLGPLESRTTQAEVECGALSLQELRRLGLKVFTTPFNKYDGFGDGLIDPSDTTSPGGRPTLQHNGTFLRVNGLGAQTCLECHCILSMDTIPFSLGIGGFAGLTASVLFQPTLIDVADTAGNGYAAYDGRLINPPAVFGVGGVELVANEMTEDLQELKQEALSKPGKTIRLQTKGVDFGLIVADSSGNLDVSGMVGIEEDLVVRPFGRKGEFFSVRQFDLGAMMLHFGMQPVELVGENVDADDDGVTDEVLIGENSVLEIFLTTMERPFIASQGKQEKQGFQCFKRIGCADCHRPEMKTRNALLGLRFPEIATDPSQNVFYIVDLAKSPPPFERNKKGGLIIRMFSDLKRHDMGDALAESFHRADEQQNREFITAKLWGVADTAPYLHDGRAMTLHEAIMLHGGEAEAAREAYMQLKDDQKNDILLFLKSLRNPLNPNQDVLTP